MSLWREGQPWTNSRATFLPHFTHLISAWIWARLNFLGDTIFVTLGLSATCLCCFRDLSDSTSNNKSCYVSILDKNLTQPCQVSSQHQIWCFPEAVCLWTAKLKSWFSKWSVIHLSLNSVANCLKSDIRCFHTKQSQKNFYMDTKPGATPFTGVIQPVEN